MSSNSSSDAGDSSLGALSSVPTSVSTDKQKEKARVSRTSLILWHAHQNDAAAVRKLLEEDPSLVRARDYDNRTSLHVASLHGWIEVAKCLIEFGADVNAQDRWKNTVPFLLLSSCHIQSLIFVPATALAWFYHLNLDFSVVAASS